MIKKISLALSAVLLAAVGNAQNTTLQQSVATPAPVQSQMFQGRVGLNSFRHISDEALVKIGDKISPLGGITPKKAVALMQNSKSTQFRNGIAKASTPQRKTNYTAADTVFFENWANYNGTSWDYYPTTSTGARNNWVRYTKVPDSDVSEIDGRNARWMCYETDGYYAPYAVSGRYVAMCMGADDVYGVDGETVISPAPEQDEWLVTPAITNVKASNRLQFDLAYAPYYQHYFIEDGKPVFDPERISFDVEVLISVNQRSASNNESTYTKVWKLSDAVKEEMAGLDLNNEDDARQLLSWTWHHFSLPMEEFAGNSNIRVAFRYKGRKGATVLLDAVRVSDLLPSALYTKPEGTFNFGWNYDGFYQIGRYRAVLAPTNTDLVWPNLSTDLEVAEWSYKNNDDKTVSSNDENLVMKGEGASGFKPWPTLYANAGARSDSYDGSDPTVLFSAGAYKLGGTAEQTFNGSVMGFVAGNYDTAKGYWLAPTTSSNDAWIFGTGGGALWAEMSQQTQGEVKGIGELFDKPAAPYLMTTVIAHFGQFSIAYGKPRFTCTIYKVKGNEITDEILYQSSITSADVLQAPSADGNGYIMQFPFASADKPIVIDEPIFVTIKGFYSQNVSAIAPIVQANNHVDGKGTAFVILENLQGGDDYYVEVAGALHSIDPTSADNMKVSFFMGMNAIFPYVYSTEGNVYEAPTAGGIKSFDMDTYMAPTTWEISTDADWFTAVSNIDYNTSTCSLQITADAMPSGVTGRSGYVTVKSFGCETKILVLQGDAVTGIESTEVSNGPTVASVFGMGGQLVKQTVLPVGASVESIDLPRGTYLVRTPNKTIKIVK